MSIVASYMVPHPPLIVPEVGRGSEGQVRKTIESYKRVAEDIAKMKPETIIISSPHATMYSDYFHISPGKSAKGSFADFSASKVKFAEEYDTELVSRIELLARREDFPAGTMGERKRELDHGTMVPLYFIRQKYSDFKIIRIGLSGLSLTDHYKLGTIIAEAVRDTGRRAVYVASGDLSHKLQEYGPYGFAKEGPEYDERIMDVASRGAFGEMLDFEETFCEKAAECGHRSFVMMAGALDGLSVDIETLSHEDVTGVGYGLCIFHVKRDDAGNVVEDESRRFLEIHLKKELKRLADMRSGSDAYVRLARRSLETYIMNGKTISTAEGMEGFSDEEKAELMSNQAGAFVSIHEHGMLRGCIGTILPTEDSVAEEIIHNAISASTRDPRFEPIIPSEIPYLEVNVDVLGKPEPIKSKAELDVKRYGVIVTCGMKRGLLLPDLDGVDTVDQQVSIAMRKGGIKESDRYSLERFEVIRHI
ncbi:MAG: AmmeMemoRadiSam system protein A [Eubacterium sp.]|nr:AmmeMemoRadiSam system protein A [Eubacterium sp.]